jgi:hypothetical protein
MMMGFHAVTQWQNETFHFLYHMNIITLTHFNSRMGKKAAKTLLREHRGNLLPLVKEMLFVSLFRRRFGANDDVIKDVSRIWP